MIDIRRIARVVAAAVCLVIVAPPAPAEAHPLGNFTINRFSGIEISRDVITIHYVVDMAEIPTFQEMSRIDPDGDGSIDATERDSYAALLADRLASNIALTISDRPVEVAVERADAVVGEGQGGLDVLRVEADLVAPSDDATATIDYRDSNYSGRLGWSEIVAYASGGRTLTRSTVPAESVSNELRDYPEDLLASPVDVATARLSVRPGASGAGRAEERGSSEPARDGLLGDRFAALIGEDLTPGFLLVALLLALGAGALHALGPGHGKTIMAAYLIGSGGKMRHAVTVGVAVSLMHTLSVVALGLVTLWASSLFPPEAVYPWLAFLSGVVVLSLGVWLLRTRWSARRRFVVARHRAIHAHRTDIDGHDHVHHHHHPHEHDHVHTTGTHSHGGISHSHALPEGASPLSWKGLGAIAISGGLLPSPTALVVLLGAVALHRVVYGVILVAAFSVGLAAALTLVGVMVLKARSIAERRFGAGFGTLMPVLSATAIFAIGLFLTARGAVGL
ncbi:MAG: nickel/cobalt transporter [Actinomycetota bacterium]